MAERAIELINKLLSIFNNDTGEYINLVGDTLRTERTIAGDTSKQIKSLEIKGYTLSNTDNYKLYWELNDAAGTRTLSFWKDSGKTSKVLEGSNVGDGAFTLSAVGGSGLSGTTYVEYSTDDTDNANIIYILNLEGDIKLNDINTGSISNALEYTKRLNDFLVDQLDLTTASDSWLDYIGENMYGIDRLGGESDADYSTRIIQKTVEVQCTVVAITNMLEDYGDNVLIVEGIDDGAFADISFANNYKDFNRPGEDVVKAALAGDFNGLPFFFRVIMENVDPANYKLILDLIDDYKAAGVQYVVQID